MSRLPELPQEANKLNIPLRNLVFKKKLEKAIYSPIWMECLDKLLKQQLIN